MQSTVLIIAERWGEGLGRLRDVLLLLSSVTLAGCGLIYPDASEIEYPDPQLPADPFHFADILKDTRERFAKLNREDLFHERFRYFGNDGRIYGRKPLFDRFDEVENRYFRESSTDMLDTSLQVAWTRSDEKSSEPLTFDRNDTVSLYRDYSITVRREIFDSLPSTIVYRGHARFELVFHSFRNAWTIFEWHDSHEAPGLTFFHPEFRN